MKNTIKYALFGAVLALVTPAFAADAPDCYKMSVAIKKAVAAHPDKVLELVATQVAQNESCACEVVKAAIVASDADKKLVADIVDAAVTAAPSKVRIIGQCAVAVAPDALAEVQAVVAKMDSVGAGSFSDLNSPLNVPDGGWSNNPVGPGLFGEGGAGLLPPSHPVITPPSSTSE